MTNNEKMDCGVCLEYFLATTNNPKIFLKGARHHITKHFTKDDYEFCKSVMGSYNAQNKKKKLGLAMAINTVYLCEYTCEVLGRKLQSGVYVFQIG